MNQESSSAKIGILTKISYFLAGVLLCMLTFSVFARLLTNIWGLGLGILANVAGAGIIANRWKHNSKLKIVGYGIIATVILITLISITLWSLLFSLFSQIAS